MQLCGCGIAQIYRSLAISALGPENDVVLLIAEGFVWPLRKLYRSRKRMSLPAAQLAASQRTDES
jgi:hypothetical protein